MYSILLVEDEIVELRQDELFFCQEGYLIHLSDPGGHIVNENRFAGLEQTSLLLDSVIQGNATMAVQLLIEIFGIFEGLNRKSYCKNMYRLFLYLKDKTSVSDSYDIEEPDIFQAESVQSLRSQLIAYVRNLTRIYHEKEENHLSVFVKNYINLHYKEDCTVEKMADGYVFSTWGSYWDTDAVNEQLTQKCGKDAKFYCYKVVADGLSEDETTYNARNSLGWDAIGITDNCKNVEAAMKVLDFLASEEGQYLLLWGPKGKTWNIRNGKHVPSFTFLEEWATYSESIEQETGVRRWTWMIKNGNGSDETPYDLTTKYVPSDVMKFANANFKESDYWDTSEFSGLEPTVSSDCGFQWQNIQDIYKQYYTKIICASSADQAKISYDRMLE